MKILRGIDAKIKESNLWACSECKGMLQKFVLELELCSFQGISVDKCLRTKYPEHGIVLVERYANC
jgi:hypothetical protein